MRRFINSVSGKISSVVAIFALLMPTVVLFSLSQRAEAQVVSLPTWAVVNFDVKQGVGGASLGQAASEAMINELSKSQRYDVLSSDTVTRTIQNLGIVEPVSRKNDLMRLAQNLRANTIVSGEIVNSRVVKVGDSKRADVMMRVIVWDVASGEQVNGAAVQQSSGVRAGDTSDETLLSEAVGTAAFDVVNAIQRNTLPVATILNTTSRRALINQGTRSGFTAGQEVIVIRGREQVARGKIAGVEADQAFVEVTQQIKGIQPGDRVRAVFSVPQLDSRWSASGETRVVKSRPRGGSSGAVSTILVLLLVGFLVGGAGGNSGGNLTKVTAEPTTVPGAPDDQPAVRISWRVDAFIKGNQDRVQFQVWRDDVPDTPVLVVPGSASSAIDRGNAGDTFTWGNYSQSGGFDCNSDAPGEDGTGAPIRAGLPYTYSVELIYRVNSIDVPGSNAGTSGGSTGGTGTTGGTAGTTAGSTGGTGTTGGGTRGDGARPSLSLNERYTRMVQRQGTTTGSTSGTTGGTTGGTLEFCYFRTDRRVASGTATPFVRPRLSSPANNQTVAAPTIFRFSSIRGANANLNIEYCLQFSTDPLFATNVRTIVKFQDRTGTGTLSTPVINEVTSVFPSATRVYWRVGGRNLADAPGPIAQGGERYIFSEPFWFQRPVLPPTP